MNVQIFQRRSAGSVFISDGGGCIKVEQRGRSREDIPARRIIDLSSRIAQQSSGIIHVERIDPCITRRAGNDRERTFDLTDGIHPRSKRCPVESRWRTVRSHPKYIRARTARNAILERSEGGQNGDDVVARSGLEADVFDGRKIKLNGARRCSDDPITEELNIVAGWVVDVGEINHRQPGLPMHLHVTLNGVQILGGRVRVKFRSILAVHSVALGAGTGSQNIERLSLGVVRFQRTSREFIAIHIEELEPRHGHVVIQVENVAAVEAVDRYPGLVGKAVRLERAAIRADCNRLIGANDGTIDNRNDLRGIGGEDIELCRRNRVGNRRQILERDEHLIAVPRSWVAGITGTRARIVVRVDDDLTIISTASEKGSGKVTHSTDWAAGIAYQHKLVQIHKA